MNRPSRHLRRALFVGALFGAELAAAACDPDWLGVDTQADGARREVVVTNHTPYPLTYTLRVRGRGLALDGPRTMTATLEPHASGRATAWLADAGDRAPRLSCRWTVGRLEPRHDDSYLYLLPYASGRSYRVLQGYGSRFSHTGREQYAVDFKMREGTPVHAARGGVVARVEERHSIGCWRDGCGRYANFIVVLHDDGTTGEYYHLKQHGALVEAGQRVAAGDLIGLSGNTGHSALPHLHFAVYRAVDWGRTQSIPVRFLTADGVVSSPRRGGHYPAVGVDALERRDRDSD